MRLPSRTRSARRLLALATLVMILASACSAADTQAASSTAADFAAGVAEAPRAADAMDVEEMEMEESAGAMAEVAADESSATTGSTGTQAQAQLMDLGRDIIYTAHLDLASTNVSDATREAVRSVESLGGFLFSQETSGQNGTSRLVFKVLPEQFATTLERLGGIGTVRSQAVNAEDVTSIVVDLESRITTAEASVVRLRALIEEANDFQIIAQLENQLLDRETTLERLRGQLRSVQNQVDLATINVSIVQLQNRASVGVTLTALPEHDGGQRCSLGQGQPSVSVDGPTTLCLHITNRGDLTLTSIDLVDPVLGVSLEEFVALAGDLDRLAPGMTALAIAEIDVTEAVESLRTSVVAQGIDADDERVGDQIRSTSPALWIQVPETDELPGFAEVLSGSWNAIKTIAILLAIALVAVAPFAAAALLLSPVLVWIWRRLPRPTPTSQHTVTTAPPPPPPSTPALAPDTTEEAGETTVTA